MKRLYLGIELGSTRVKSVLLDEKGNTISSGSFNWENEFKDGYWTYDLNLIKDALRTSYKEVKRGYFDKFKKKITKIDCIGISAMMHGLIALDEKDNLLTPFRTWRNNNTYKESKELTELTNFHIPERWSLAHLFYSINNKEPFYKDIAKIETLSSYVHYLLSKVRAIGINDASGMTKVTSSLEYDEQVLKLCDKALKDKGFTRSLNDILPPIYKTGCITAKLTKEGLALLDEDKDLKEAYLCPPEGDAITGIVATNTVKKGEMNISCGTSIFANIILKDELKKPYSEVDIVNSYDGSQIAMIHCNNCTSAIDEWVDVFRKTLKLFGLNISDKILYKTLFEKALTSTFDISKVVLYNYLSGENITSIKDGALVIAKTDKPSLDPQTIILCSLFSAFTTLSIGLDIIEGENIKIDKILAHGGIFKTESTSQKILASVLNKEVYVNSNSSEGGAYGMGTLALYTSYVNKMSFEEFLNEMIFKNNKEVKELPSKELREKFLVFKENFKKALPSNEILGKELKRYA